MIRTAFDDFPTPPCAALLGTRLVAARPSEGWLRMAFDGREAFLNPAGFIQGGLLAAMLDDTMGPAVLLMTEGSTYTVTLDMHVTYFEAARPGPIFGEATVIRLGKTIGFVEGRLMSEHGVLLARASATARLVPTTKLAGAKER